MLSEHLNPIEDAIQQLRARGIVLRHAPGGFVVNYKGGKSECDFWTDDISAALAHGLALEPAVKALAPLGPMGTNKGKMRAQMYAHNRRVAAKRTKLEKTQSDK